MKNVYTLRWFAYPLILALAWILTSQKPSEKTIPANYNAMTNPVLYDAKNLAAGAKIYKKLCWTCHGDKGAGNGPGSLEIANKPADFNHPIVLSRTDGAMFWWISVGGNDMQAYKDVLTKQEIWQSVIYVRKLQNKIH